MLKMFKFYFLSYKLYKRIRYTLHPSNLVNTLEKLSRVISLISEKVLNIIITIYPKFFLIILKTLLNSCTRFD